jgi:hypothetical protein
MDDLTETAAAAWIDCRQHGMPVGFCDNLVRRLAELVPPAEEPPAREWIASMVILAVFVGIPLLSWLIYRSR